MPPTLELGISSPSNACYAQLQELPFLQDILLEK